MRNLYLNKERIRSLGRREIGSRESIGIYVKERFRIE